MIGLIKKLQPDNHNYMHTYLPVDVPNANPRTESKTVVGNCQLGMVVVVGEGNIERQVEVFNIMHLQLICS